MNGRPPLPYGKPRKRPGAALWFFLLALTAAILTGSHRPVARVTSLEFDAGKPFALCVGMGVGWFHRLVVVITEDGEATMTRFQPRPKRLEHELLETATMRLSPEQRREVAQLVKKYDLAHWRSQYLSNVSDGAYSITRLRQGGAIKQSYFQREHTAELLGFWQALEALLSAAGADQADWKPISSSASDELAWISLERSR